LKDLLIVITILNSIQRFVQISLTEVVDNLVNYYRDDRKASEL